MTLEAAEKVLNKYEQLVNIAHQYEQQYLRSGGYRSSGGEIRFQNGYPEYHVNTACHCHPEYEWIPLFSYKGTPEVSWEDYLAKWDDEEGN